MRTLQYGLMIWEVQPSIMPEAHHHNDIELIYMESGAVSYLYHTQPLTLNAGDLFLFWAAIPHQLRDLTENCTMHIITIPLNIFLGWGLKESFVSEIMDGKPIIHANMLSKSNLVEGYFRQWQRDLGMASTERREIVLLELQALIKRFSLYGSRLTQSNTKETLQNTPTIHAQAIAKYIAGNYTQPLTLKQIAAQIGIHPAYASTLFAEEFQISLWDYLAQYRIAHAQRLLILTDTRIDTIAELSGFTSISQFYAVFKQICGQSPKKFRLASRSR